MSNNFALSADYDLACNAAKVKHVNPANNHTLAHNDDNALLIEFLTEELPPHDLKNAIGSQFAASITRALAGFIEPTHGSIEVIATPRRFGVIISGMRAQAKDEVLLKKGPAVNLSLVNNEPTKALNGFMQSLGISDVNQLISQNGYFYAKELRAGLTLKQVLPQAIMQSLKQLTSLKSMHWNDHEFMFVRPVHNLLILFNDATIELKESIFGLRPVNYSFGHRFMAHPNKIIIDNAKNYKQIMYKQGFVIVNYEERATYIKQELFKAANTLHLSLLFCDGDQEVNALNNLINEVTALVEYPVVLSGEFASDFLSVPQECLALSMAKHQKYFALFAPSCKGAIMANKFLFVANLASKQPELVVKGNEKVLTARLADAKFFFNHDKKHSLASLNRQLSQVTYHHKLGSMLERVERIKELAVQIAIIYNQSVNQDKPQPEGGECNQLASLLDLDLVRHSAELVKADLVTTMVGEFPELQGVMGYYYALNQGESRVTATVIKEHYCPRFSGDSLPSSALASVVALADKLDMIVGMWSIGLVPTGDKDPFALRRAAIGIGRILFDYEFSLPQLLALSVAVWPPHLINNNTQAKIVQEVQQFICQRVEKLLNSNGVASKICRSIFATNLVYFTHINTLAASLVELLASDDYLAIINANKRIGHILAKVENGNPADIANANIKQHLLPHESAHKLYDLYQQEHDKISQFGKDRNWQGYFSCLKAFAKPLDEFFATVMVMCEDMTLRQNNFVLIAKLYRLLNCYCSLGELL